MVRSGLWSNKVLCALIPGYLGGLLSVVGCTTLEPRPDFDSPLPQDRFLAARAAKAASDEGAVEDLIRQLSSDDVLVRLVAIDALASITGERFGFEADAPLAQRRSAVMRWMAWYAGAGPGGDDVEGATDG